MTAPKQVIVIGAGIIGASIAWHLTKAGAQVTVIADSAPGGVATPNSFAWINASWGNPEPYFRLRIRAMAEWKRLANDLPGLPLSWCGGLNWDLPADSSKPTRPSTLHGATASNGLTGSKWHASSPTSSSFLILPCMSRRKASQSPWPPRKRCWRTRSADGARVLSSTVTALSRPMEGSRAWTHRMGCCRRRGGDRRWRRLAGHSRDGWDQAADRDAAWALIVHSRPYKKLLNGLVHAEKLHMRQTAEGRVIAGSDFAGGDPGDDPEPRRATCSRW